MFTLPTISVCCGISLDLEGLLANISSWSTPHTRRWLLGVQTVEKKSAPTASVEQKDGPEEHDIILPPLMNASGGYVRQNMVFGSVRRT